MVKVIKRKSKSRVSNQIDFSFNIHVETNENYGNWHLSIPKVIYFYWGGPKLPFLRFMSLYSFKKFNPDWKIILFKPAVLSDVTLWPQKQYDTQYTDFKDYSDSVKNIGVEVQLFDFKDIGFSNNLNEVHKSDILRYYLLYKYGGIWSDIDILYLKSINDINCNIHKNLDKESFICAHDCFYGHTVGFLMSKEGSDFYKDVYSECKKFVNQPKEYQFYGANILNEKFGHHTLNYDKMFNLDKFNFYYFDHDKKDLLFYNFNPKNYKDILDKIVGVHWYGGSLHVKDLLLKVNDVNYIDYPNEGLIVWLLKRYFSDY